MLASSHQKEIYITMDVTFIEDKPYFTKTYLPGESKKIMEDGWWDSGQVLVQDFDSGQSPSSSSLDKNLNPSKPILQIQSLETKHTRHEAPDFNVYSKRKRSTVLAHAPISEIMTVLVTRNVKGWVKATRGLRQGDPLSSFLFTIVVDVLSRMLTKMEESGLTKGFLVGRDRTTVSLLQFEVIASIYGTHPHGWDVSIMVRWSHKCPWKAIAQVFQGFAPPTRFVVENGERIRF
ncbi:hypothetical protein CK203_061980 [Vitis vinifera]|uniref:Reverse transcriptase domain-containing protein n=1 Tax=Vitis vinifera TaxID=29760 RepID=A0A438FXU4_VITVI|nr:hypothetical protein CK203_061980 [Vitis vinifera]